MTLCLTVSGGQDQSVSFLNLFNQNPARNCCSLAGDQEAYSVLLHQMTMLENQRAPDPGDNLRRVTRTPHKFARNGVFCLRRQYTHEYTFPFWVVSEHLHLGHLRQRNLL